MNLSLFLKYLNKINVSPKKVGLTIYYVILSIILVFLLVRRPLLDYTIHKALNKIHVLSNDTATISEYNYVGVRGVYLKNITIFNSNKDTLFHCDSFYVKIKIFPIIVGRIRLSEIYINNALLTLIKKGDIRNYDFLFKRNQDSSIITKTIHEYNLSKILTDAAKGIFNIIPQKTTIDSCSVKFNIDNVHSEIRVVSFIANKKDIHGEVIIFNNKNIISNIALQGIIDRDDELFQLHLGTTSKNTVQFPMLEQALKANLKFDSIKFACRNKGANQFQFDYELFNFKFYSEKISSGTMSVKKFASKIDLTIGSDFIQIDSSSIIALNGIEFHPYLRKENTKMNGFSIESFVKSGKLELGICRTNWDAAVFFDGLPEGIFSSLRGIKAQGQLHYVLNLSLDPENIDSLVFNTSFQPKNLKIVSFGNLNITKLNNPFMHEVYEKGYLVDSVWVGSENRYFTPFNAISPNLVNAVLTSEDGSFMFHRGFNEAAFRGAMIDNIKKWRFVRGGSTISMQLVKNAFLTRNKNIARKIEEALIVWMLEHYRVTTKERMLEVYFNIIEWGPSVYGIAEASEFYFDKLPSQLDLTESIFLASIVPKPKYFYSTFEKNGMMKNYYKDYVRLVVRFMLKNGTVTEIDTPQIKTNILLTGKAADFFKMADTLMLPMDSIPEIEKIEIFN